MLQPQQAALPRWAELPDLALYMDQVLLLAERALARRPGVDRRGLTASMVNNYVKLGVLPAPAKKKYSRAHVARLLMICLLKSVFPIAAIQKLIESGVRGSSEAEFYDGFCDLYEQSMAAASREAAEPTTDRILGAALRSQAEQALSLQLLEQMDPA